MKANEFLTERMDAYDSILHGLLKIVAHAKKTGRLPFQSYTPNGEHRSVPKKSVWGLLMDLGIDEKQLDVYAKYPETQEMNHAVRTFIKNMSSGSNRSVEIKDVAPLAKIIYDWLQSMEEREYTA